MKGCGRAAYNRVRTRDRAEDGLGWVFFEVLLALGIAIAIVWWTLPKKPKRKEGDAGGSGPGEPPPG